MRIQVVAGFFLATWLLFLASWLLGPSLACAEAGPGAPTKSAGESLGEARTMAEAAISWDRLKGALCEGFGTYCGRKLRIATWNMANLYHLDDQDIPGRSGSRRSAQDFEDLRRFARELDADVIALQEVNSEAAIYRVFPEDKWLAIVSDRKRHDIDSNNRETDGIYTGFVVKKGIEVTKSRSVSELSVQHTEKDGTTRPTRWGLEIEIDHDGKTLGFLAVHLKSRCSTGDLDDDNVPDNAFEHSLNPHCTTLAKQIPVLDKLIDEREAAGQPFFVMGDFNRAFDVAGSRDVMWRRIDDRLPEGARLWRFPFGRAAECWRGTPGYHLAPIDFIVADNEAAKLVAPDSQGWVTYEATLFGMGRNISDHCPVYVDLNW